MATVDEAASPGARGYGGGVAAEAGVGTSVAVATAERGSPGAYHDASAVPRVRDPLAVVIPVTVIYLTIFITGILGNVITCLVIRRNKSMHTATNFYLFSLSISDLLLLITGLPQEMYYIWSRYPYIFGEAFCIIRGLAAEASGNATVLTITALTVERYVAICHPFYCRTLSKLSRATRLVLVVWIVALAFAVPTAAQVGVVALENPEFSMCTIKHYSYSHYFCFLSVIFFLIPMSVIIVLYVLIGLRLRRSEGMEGLSEPGTATAEVSDGRHLATLNRRSGGRPHGPRSTRRVIKMLVAVVIAFFLCWAPFHTQRLVAIYGSNSDNTPKNPHMLKLYGIITYASGILYYLSTTINPILYNIMSFRFREAFKETVWVCCRRFREDKRRPYNNLPPRIQSPYKVGETDFASRSPPRVTDSNSGFSNHRGDARCLARLVDAMDADGKAAGSPMGDPDTPVAEFRIPRGIQHPPLGVHWASHRRELVADLGQAEGDGEDSGAGVGIGARCDG